jgi:uncharacterized membrane protein YeaQ/YmgE (transglycosylase-associated protein family)
MDDAQVGWIAAIIIGGIASWLAEQFMKSNMGLLMNIVLGIIVAAVASAILSVLGTPRRMARLSDCRLYRRGFADLGLAADRSTSGSLTLPALRAEGALPHNGKWLLAFASA